MTRKPYRDPPQSERCEHRASVGTKGESAQCGRRKKINGYCQQHHEMAEARVAAFREKVASGAIKLDC